MNENTTGAACFWVVQPCRGLQKGEAASKEERRRVFQLP